MSPAAKAIAYGIVSLAAFAAAFWWAYAVLDRSPQGCHAREDAPTLGDVLADWIGEHVRGCLHLADDIAHWKPVRGRTTRRAVGRLRAPAAASAPGEGTVSGTSAQETVPLEVRVTASDGHPAVAFRPGKQPWLTDDLPKLPDVIA